MSQNSSHYQYYFKGLLLDPYRIMDVYGITEAPQQHVIKKLLRCGNSVKSIDRDIDECIEALQRWKYIRNENQLQE